MNTEPIDTGDHVLHGPTGEMNDLKQLLKLADQRVTLFQYYVRRCLTRQEALALILADIAEASKTKNDQ